MKMEPLVITVIEATQARMSAAFTEWERRYREEPARFMSEAQKLLTETPRTYGDACAPYFLSIMQEQAGAAPARTTEARIPSLPAIGKEWLGGIYAGITVHGERPHVLVLLPGDVSSVDWQRAQEWAKEQGGVAPSRMDMLMLWQNLRAEFKDAWYWTSEVYEKDADFAWFQVFGLGDQYDGLKSGTFRCRAVRRVAI